MKPEILALLFKPTITPDETSLVLDTTRNATYDAIARGRIRSFRIGRLIKIPTAPLRKKLGIFDERAVAA